MLALPLVASASDHGPGAVYTMNNAANANRLLVFARDAKGELKLDHSIPTGGRGNGAGLGSQGALALSHDGQWLLCLLYTSPSPRDS